MLPFHCSLSLTHNDELRWQHQQLCLKSIFAFLIVLTKFCIMFCGLFCVQWWTFWHAFCANCSEPSTLIMAIINFPIHILAHSSFVVMQQLSWIIPLHFTSVSIIAAIAGWPLWDPSPMPFPPLSQQTQHLPQIKSKASSPYMLLSCLWIYQIEAFCSKINSITALQLICPHQSFCTATVLKASDCLEHRWPW